MKRWNQTYASLLFGLALASCGGSAAQEIGNGGPAAPILVRVAPVTDTMVARPIIAAGTLVPKDEIALGFRTGGVIARIAVDAGDRVRAGQTLASLDLREINAALSKARSNAAKAERDLARARRLYADSVVALAQYQDAETVAEQAQADLEAAAYNRRYSVIVAPSHGTILRRSAEPGENISAGAAVLVLGSGSRGNVVQAGLADRDAVVVRIGDPAVARFDALPGKAFQGRITQIAAAADPGTGTYAVEVAVPDAAALAAGLVGTIEIRPRQGARTSLVPIEAILEADGVEATLYALSADGDQAERRRVTVDFIDGSLVAVADGLEGASAVVTDGAAYLDDGSAVRVVP
jgi:multidrug efflux system membrane fusion protein